MCINRWVKFEKRTIVHQWHEQIRNSENMCATAYWPVLLIMSGISSRKIRIRLLVDTVDTEEATDDRDSNESAIDSKANRSWTIIEMWWQKSSSNVSVQLFRWPFRHSKELKSERIDKSLFLGFYELLKSTEGRYLVERRKNGKLMVWGRVG